MLKLKLQYFGHLMQRADSLEKDPDAGKDWKQEKKGIIENEMVGWHHRLAGHEVEQALGVGNGQGSLVCCSPWGHKKSNTTELNWTAQPLALYTLLFQLILMFGKGKISPDPSWILLADLIIKQTQDRVTGENQI